jgi:hypothetical protein
MIGTKIYYTHDSEFYGTVVDETKLTNEQLCRAIRNYEEGLWVVQLPGGSYVLHDASSDAFTPTEPIEPILPRVRKVKKAARRPFY